MKLELVYCHTCLVAHAPGEHTFLRKAVVVPPPSETAPEKTGMGLNPAERYLAQEASKKAAGKRGATVVKPKPSSPMAMMAARLADTEKKLEELRAKERSKKAKWRANRKMSKSV